MKRKQEELPKVKSEIPDLSRSFRDAPPAHYTFKIQSFSLISHNSIEKYESNVFESGGYKWKLLFYPKGDPKVNEENHISLYLVIAETGSLRPGWEVNVTFKLFLFDQTRDKYFTVEDSGRVVRRFHVAKTEWGFSQFIPLASFNDPSNGYLVNDTCVFGAEVYVRNGTGQGECWSMIHSPRASTYTWKVAGFSKLPEHVCYSEVISSGEHKWKIMFYPKGDRAESKNKFISLYLIFADLASSSRDKKYVRYTLRVRDQLYSKHKEYTSTSWFTALGLGWSKFAKLSILNDLKQGFLVDNTLIIEADVTVLGSVKSFS